MREKEGGGAEVKEGIRVEEERGTQSETFASSGEEYFLSHFFWMTACPKSKSFQCRLEWEKCGWPHLNLTERKLLAGGLWIGMARNPRLDFIFEIHE